MEKQTETEQNDVELKAFESHLNRLGLSKRTSREYTKVITSFTQANDITTMSDDDIIKTLAAFVLPRNILVRGAMAAYMRWLDKEQTYLTFCKKFRHNLAPKDVKKSRDVLTLEEAKQVIEHLPQPSDLVALLQCDTGARANAILTLQVSGIRQDDDGDHKIIIREKGSRFRTLYISPVVAGFLQEFITSNEIKESVFLCLGKSPATRYYNYERVLRDVSAKFFEERGEKRHISSHVFRRSKAAWLLQNGYNIVDIQQLLGHKNIQTTSIYLSGAGLTSKRIMQKEGHKWEQ